METGNEIIKEATNNTAATPLSENISNTNGNSSTRTMDSEGEEGRMKPRVMIVCNESENNSVQMNNVDLSIVSESIDSNVVRVSSEAVIERLCENGYDSDGNPAPEIEELEIIDEESFPVEEDLMEEATTNTEATLSEPVDDRPEEEVIIIARSEIMKFKVDELRTELKKRGLRVKGLKSELQANLIKAMEDRVPICREVTEEVNTIYNLYFNFNYY